MQSPDNNQVLLTRAASENLCIFATRNISRDALRSNRVVKNRLEDALGTNVKRVTHGVLIYDAENPPDFDAVARESGLTCVVWLPDNGRGDLDPKDVLCGEKTQASER